MKNLLRGVFFIAVALLALASLLPVIETNVWWIRSLDFIRLQLAIALAVAILAGLLLGAARRPTTLVATLACVGLLGYQVYKLYPYTPISPVMAAEMASCPAGEPFKLMIANVKMGNRNFDAFARVVDGVDPDIFLAMETDQWWDEKLATLANRYPYRVDSVADASKYYGLHLFSRFELVDPRIEFWFESDTPTVISVIRLPAGEIAFTGLHPRPPQSFDQPTTLRDGHLAKAALDSAESPTPSILAGDFNAVPWERIVRRALRVGQLLDPRVGRGFFNSFGADSPIIAWPLDQILFQARIGMIGYERLPDIGSDHYPMMATLCVSPSPVPGQSAPALEEGDFDEFETTIEAARERL